MLSLRKGFRIAAMLTPMVAASASQAQTSPATDTDRVPDTALDRALDRVPEPPSATVDLLEVFRGQGTPMNADDAARQAVATSPAVARSQAAADQSDARREELLYTFIPQVDFGARYTRLSDVTNPPLFETGEADPSGIVNMVNDPASRALWTILFSGFQDSSFPVILDSYSLTMGVSYPVSDVFFTALPSYQSAEAGRDASRQQVLDAEHQAALRGREAYYDYARARGAWAVAQLSLQNAEARRAQARAFVAAGTAAPVEGFRADAQVASAEVAVARTEGTVAIARNTLATVLHLSGQPDIQVTEDITEDLPELPGSLTELVAEAADARADIKALRHLIRARSLDIDAAEGSRLPSFGVGFNYDLSNPNQRIIPQSAEFNGTWDLSAVVNWSPHDLLTGERRADQARAGLMQAQQNLRELEDGLRVQVFEAAQSYESARRALSAARLGVRAAQENYRVQMERYRAGASTTTDVIQASVEQDQAQLDVLNAFIDARQAWSRLLRGLGRR